MLHTYRIILLIVLTLVLSGCGNQVRQAQDLPPLPIPERADQKVGISASEYEKDRKAREQQGTTSAPSP